jgi:hypothetical protein
VRVIISLSEARFQIARARAKNGRLPRHHETAVKSLIAFIGADMSPLLTVTEPADSLAWYGHIKSNSKHAAHQEKIEPMDYRQLRANAQGFFQQLRKNGVFEPIPLRRLGACPDCPKRLRKDIIRRGYCEAGCPFALVATRSCACADSARYRLPRGGMISMRACDVKIRSGRRWGDAGPCHRVREDEQGPHCLFWTRSVSKPFKSI